MPTKLERVERTQPWFRAGEQLAIAFGAMPRLEMTNGDMQRHTAMWAAFMAEIPNDPSALPT